MVTTRKDQDQEERKSAGVPVTGKKEILKKRKVTQEDVLEQQYKALQLKQENLLLKKRKLQLEVLLLEKRVDATQTSSNCQEHGEPQLITLQLRPSLED